MQPGQLFTTEEYTVVPVKSSEDGDNLVEELAGFLEAWTEETLSQNEAKQFATTLAEQVRKNWGAIQTFVASHHSGITPRFISEVEIWSRECLSAMGVEGFELDTLVALVKDKVWDQYGNQIVYFKKTDPRRTEQIMKDRESGMDRVDLARKYDLSTPRLYEIINHGLKMRRTG